MPERKVLLVNDEKGLTKGPGGRIRIHGLEITRAGSASDAVRMAGEEAYDVIVMDLMTYGVDGLDAVRTLKEKNPELHVFLLAGPATLEKGIAAMMSGTADILERPSNVDELARRIKKTLSKKMIQI